MYTTISGIYENGKITLLEVVPTTAKVAVIVTFLEPNMAAVVLPKKERKLGSLKGKISIPNDFNKPLEDLKDYM